MKKDIEVSIVGFWFDDTTIDLMCTLELKLGDKAYTRQLNVSTLIRNRK